mgnify:CR=1 FL=1
MQVILFCTQHYWYNTLMQSGQSEPQKPEAGWVFRPGADAAAPSATARAYTEKTMEQQSVKATGGSSVSWTAQEFVEHDRSASWYLILGIGAVVLAGIVLVLTGDKITVGMILIVALIFGSFARKKPRTLDYSLDNEGITLGSKKYSYNLFKSFSVNEEGPLHSLILMPLKRFMPLISVYYPSDNEEKILQKIANFLPFEEHKQDFVDKMMNKIRF